MIKIKFNGLWLYLLLENHHFFFLTFQEPDHSDLEDVMMHGLEEIDYLFSMPSSLEGFAHTGPTADMLDDNDYVSGEHDYVSDFHDPRGRVHHIDGGVMGLRPGTGQGAPSDTYGFVGSRLDDQEAVVDRTSQLLNTMPFRMHKPTASFCFNNKDKFL